MGRIQTAFVAGGALLALAGPAQAIKDITVYITGTSVPVGQTVIYRVVDRMCVGFPYPVTIRGGDRAGVPVKICATSQGGAIGIIKPDGSAGPGVQWLMDGARVDAVTGTTERPEGWTPPMIRPVSPGGLAPPAPTGADGWKTVLSVRTQTVAYRTQSIQRSGGTITVDVRISYHPPQAFEGRVVAIGNERIKIDVAIGNERIKIDCAGKTFLDLGGSKVDPAGRVVNSWNASAASEPFSPGSPVGAVAADICPRR